MQVKYVCVYIFKWLGACFMRFKGNEKHSSCIHSAPFQMLIYINELRLLLLFFNLEYSFFCSDEKNELWSHFIYLNEKCSWNDLIENESERLDIEIVNRWFVCVFFFFCRRNIQTFVSMAISTATQCNTIQMYVIRHIDYSIESFDGMEIICSIWMSFFVHQTLPSNQ